MKVFRNTFTKDASVYVLYDDGSNGLLHDKVQVSSQYVHPITYKEMLRLVDTGARFIVRTATEDLYPVKVFKTAASTDPANITVACINTVSTALAFVNFVVEDEA